MTIVKRSPTRVLEPFNIWMNFARKWEKKYGRPYVVSGRDKKACTRLTEIPYNDLMQRMDAFLRDPWAGSEWRRHELWLFATSVNRYVPNTDVFKPKDDNVQS